MGKLTRHYKVTYLDENGDHQVAEYKHAEKAIGFYNWLRRTGYRTASVWEETRLA